MSVGKRENAFPSTAVAVLDFLALCSGIGLVCAVWRTELGSKSWSPAVRGSMAIVALILIAFGVRHIVMARNPLKHLGRFHRYRVLLPREGFVYLGVMGVLLVGALLGHSNPLMLVFTLMAGPFVINGWITFTLLKRNEVDRTVPVRAMAGELLSIEMRVRNRKFLFPTLLVTVRDRIVRNRVVLEGNTLITRVPPRSTRRGHYRLRLQRRGRYSLGPVRLATSFPLGLVERSQMFQAPGEILIYPRIGRLTSQWKQDLELASEYVSRPKTRKGTYDDDFHRIREYVAGDNSSAIHWRTSARHNELMVREYHQSRKRHLVLFLDLWQPARPARAETDRVEYAVSFVATVCVDHLKTSRDAQLHVWIAGNQVTNWRARHGASSIESALDTLALVQAGSKRNLGPMIAQAMAVVPTNARMVLVTTRPEAADEATAEDQLRPLGIPEELAGQLRVLWGDPESLQAYFVVAPL